jgi:hypothetical protein
VAGRSVVSVGHLTAILVVVFVTFGLMGMSLFNYKMSSCPVDKALQVCPPGESCPDTLDCYVKCLADEVSRRGGLVQFEVRCLDMSSDAS